MIVDDAVPAHLVDGLREAARRVPALQEAAGDSFRLLTPLDGDPIFAEYFGSAELLGYVTGFLQRPLADLSLAEFYLFHQPPGTEGNPGGGWHRCVHSSRQRVLATADLSAQ